MEKRQKYFEEALSDFVHDAASGRAIRHLVDLGYSVEQMMGALSYPTPRERVQKTVYRYMMESSLLVKELPCAGTVRLPHSADGNGENVFRPVRLRGSDGARIYRYVYGKVEENGEENVYVSCPFGMWHRQEDGGKHDEKWLRGRLSYLNKREADYIAGIPWENTMLYHRLNDRMKEIGRKLLLNKEPECRYYCLRTGEVIEVVS